LAIFTSITRSPQTRQCSELRKSIEGKPSKMSRANDLSRSVKIREDLSRSVKCQEETISIETSAMNLFDLVWTCVNSYMTK
jgi:hypothetical protein